MTTWLNRQVDLLRFRVARALAQPRRSRRSAYSATASTSASPAQPLGLPVRRQRARSRSTAPATARGATTRDGELWVAPAPIRPSRRRPPTRPTTANAEDAWLPLYFAQWGGSEPRRSATPRCSSRRGRSRHRDHAVAAAQPAPDLSGVPALRYGTDYDFRVRLVDLTGGGPTSSAMPVHPGPVPVTLASSAATSRRKRCWSTPTRTCSPTRPCHPPSGHIQTSPSVAADRLPRGALRRRRPCDLRAGQPGRADQRGEATTAGRWTSLTRTSTRSTSPSRRASRPTTPARQAPTPATWTATSASSTRSTSLSAAAPTRA